MEKPFIRNYLHRNNSGFTLVGVLMVLVVLSVLGLSILIITSNSVKITAGERNDQSVFYIAEAGVVETVYNINNNVSEAFKEVKVKYDNLPIKEKEKYDFVGEFYSSVIEKVDLSPSALSFEKNLGNDPTALITLNQNGTGPIVYEIKSIGTIGNKTRTVTQELTVFLESKLIDEPAMSSDIGLYVNKTIYLDGSSKIHGNAATKSENPADVTLLGTAKVTGELLRGVKHKIDLPEFPIFPTYNMPPDQVYEKTKYEKTDVIKDGNLLIDSYLTPKFTLDMSENMEFKEIRVDSSYTLIINVGNQNREIVVDHLNVKQGFIQIKGSGKLTIYVKNNLTMWKEEGGQKKGSSTINNNGDVEKLQVYYKGSEPIYLAGSQRIYGSLYAETANINFIRGGGFYGNIYTGGTEVIVNGNASVNAQLFQAPNAKFTLENSGSIKGAVIADSFIGKGNVSVTYDEASGGSGDSMKDYGDGSNLIKKTSLIEE